jgi:hypothetical protein
MQRDSFSRTLRSRLPAAASAIVAGLAGGVFGAFLSVAHQSSATSGAGVSQPPAIEPGIPMLLISNREAHASVMVDRKGLILLNLVTRTGQKQIALGMMGDSQVEVGVFDSAGNAKAGIKVPMGDAGRVEMLLLHKEAPHNFMKS